MRSDPLPFDPLPFDDAPEWDAPGLSEPAPVAPKHERPATAAPVGGPSEPAGLEVRVIRSPKRRKTAGARLVGGVLEVRVPARMPEREVAEMVDAFEKRLLRRHRAAGVDLEQRARVLARRYGLPQPATVRWVGNQEQRWGSCSTATSAIRVSDRLAAFPPWVLDHVLVHELAHLVHADHSPAFHALVARHPRSERAIGFLIAKGLEPDDG